MGDSNTAPHSKHTSRWSKPAASGSCGPIGAAEAAWPEWKLLLLPSKEVDGARAYKEEDDDVGNMVAGVVNEGAAMC